MCGVEKTFYISATPSARVPSLSLSLARYPVKQSVLLMASVTRKSGAATESTEEPQLAAATGNDGAATEHTEEPRLAADTGNEDAATEHIEVPSYLQLFEISHDV